MFVIVFVSCLIMFCFVVGCVRFVFALLRGLFVGCLGFVWGIVRLLVCFVGYCLLFLGVLVWCLFT